MQTTLFLANSPGLKKVSLLSVRRAMVLQSRALGASEEGHGMFRMQEQRKRLTRPFHISEKNRSSAEDDDGFVRHSLAAQPGSCAREWRAGGSAA